MINFINIGSKDTLKQSKLKEQKNHFHVIKGSTHLENITIPNFNDFALKIY